MAQDPNKEDDKPRPVFNSPTITRELHIDGIKTPTTAISRRRDELCDELIICPFSMSTDNIIMQLNELNDYNYSNLNLSQLNITTSTGKSVKITDKHFDEYVAQTSPHETDINLNLNLIISNIFKKRNFGNDPNDIGLFMYYMNIMRKTSNFYWTSDSIFNLFYYSFTEPQMKNSIIYNDLINKYGLYDITHPMGKQEALSSKELIALYILYKEEKIKKFKQNIKNLREQYTPFQYYKVSLKKADEEMGISKANTKWKPSRVKTDVGNMYEAHRKRVWEYFGCEVSKKLYGAKYNIDWSITYKGDLIVMEEDKGHIFDSGGLEKVLMGFAKTIKYYQDNKKNLPILLLNSFSLFNANFDKKDTSHNIEKSFTTNKNECFDVLKKEIADEFKDIFKYTWLTDYGRFMTTDKEDEKEETEAEKKQRFDKGKKKWFSFDKDVLHCWDNYSEDELIKKDIIVIQEIIAKQISKKREKEREIEREREREKERERTRESINKRHLLDKEKRKKEKKEKKEKENKNNDIKEINKRIEIINKKINKIDNIIAISLKDKIYTDNEKIKKLLEKIVDLENALTILKNKRNDLITY